MSSDRDARIAEIEGQAINGHSHNKTFLRRDVSWLIAELRDALTREAALQKDAEGRIAIWRMYAYAAAQALTPLGETCEFDDPDSLEGAISRLVERVQSEGR